MSFPFYIRSSNPNRTKEKAEIKDKHASAKFATNAFNHPDSSSTANPGHSRNPSRMRIIPFLGKRRKSLAALRSSVIGEGSEPPDEGANGRYHKTVSQLADQTAARLAHSSLGAAGSLSTSNLELTTLKMHPPRHGSALNSTPPSNNRPSDVRHTMFPSSNSGKSTPDKLTSTFNKRCSEKPAKASFLSRVTSRPSLASRYSSADLKTSSRGLFKSSEKPQTSQRKEIVHPVPVSNAPILGDHRDFFLSPRAAPTPPNLSFASPDSSLLESPPGPSRSTVTLPSQRQSNLFAGTDPVLSPVYDNKPRSSIAPGTVSRVPGATAIETPSSLSPEMALRSPRRYSVGVQSQLASPCASKGSNVANISAESLAARPRGSHVRIGKEKVTISVANMLEDELGVDVGDSEDSSYYDDSYDENRRHQNQTATSFNANGETFASDSSDLPPLSPFPDDLNTAFKFPKSDMKPDHQFQLESQSPLSVLMTASYAGRDYSSREPVGRLGPVSIDKATVEDMRSAALDPVSSCQYGLNQSQTRVARQARPSYSYCGGSQPREVELLDRISESSVRLIQESPCNVIGDKGEKEVGAPGMENDSSQASQLQHALDIQCARFDKLAGHLLQIIQRHQSEKLQLENQISIMQKVARRNEREIKALRKLIARSDNRSSQEGWDRRRLVRVASMQSFLSNISAEDEEVDMSVAVEMLSRAGRRNVLLSPDASRVVRASVDLSPCQVPMKTEKKLDLRRTKTMPDLHKSAMAVPSPMPSPPSQEPSPNVSGLGLGLDFPLPQPLKLPSIASTIMSSAHAQPQGSNDSIPALTTASTAVSGLSLATESSTKTLTNTSGEFKPLISARGIKRSAREKRMAGEWLPGSGQGFYRPAEQGIQSSAPPTSEVPALPASASYANNLNKALVMSPVEQVMKIESPELDAMFQKLITSSSGLLD